MPSPTPPYPPTPRPEVFADPLIKVYEQATDDLLVNIARHFNVADSTAGSYEWQFRKLAEMGKLTKENIAIIAKLTGQNEIMIQEAITSAAIKSLDEIEPALAEAARKGLLSSPSTTPLISPRITELLQEFQTQALDKLNLVNTVMLNSSLEAYRRGITMTVFNVNQMEQAQKILNQAAGEVVLGTTSRQAAMRKAIKQMADEGLTGFVDKGGHHWQPESYVSMDLGTTMHNTYVQSAFNRNQDYGNDLVYAGIKATSRPLCFPWQGKILSTSGRSGYVQDLNGSTTRVYALSETTYGEPAGLWGINCGHSCNVFVPGYSIIRGEVPSEAENDARYAESQVQRKLEREVRYAKRDAMMAEAANDKEGFDKAAQLVKKRQSALNAFLDETGRAASPSRTSVVGYTRSVSAKVRAVK